MTTADPKGKGTIPGREVKIEVETEVEIKAEIEAEIEAEIMIGAEAEIMIEEGKERLLIRLGSEEFVKDFINNKNNNKIFNHNDLIIIK